MATKYVTGGAPAGSADGSSPANCWGSIASFFATNPSNDTCLCYGSETLSSVPTIGSSGSGRDEPNVVMGCDSNWTPGAAMYEIDCDGENYGIDTGAYRPYWRLSHLYIHSPTLDCLRIYGWQWTLDHLILEPTVNGLSGVTNANGFQRSVVYQCIIRNGSGSGIYCNDSSLTANRFIANHIYGFTNYGILSGQIQLCGNIIRNNATNVRSTGANSTFLYNVIHGSSVDGIYFDTGPCFVLHNSLTSNSGNVINAGGLQNISNHNGFRNNGTKYAGGIAGGDEDFDFPRDPYVDAAKFNFMMKPNSSYRRREVILDWDQANPVNKLYIPAGLISDDRPCSLYISHS